MATPTTRPTSDVGIINRLIKPDRGDFSAEIAHFLLHIEFEQSDHDRVHELSVKAQEGSLTRAEQAELNDYERVGYLLAALHSKARQFLKRNGKVRK